MQGEEEPQWEVASGARSSQTGRGPLGGALERLGSTSQKPRLPCTLHGGTATTPCRLMKGRPQALPGTLHGEGQPTSQAGLWLASLTGSPRGHRGQHPGAGPWMPRESLRAPHLLVEGVMEKVPATQPHSETWPCTPRGSPLSPSLGHPHQARGMRAKLS